MLVLWSGGCDSTLVLNDLLQTYPPRQEADGSWTYHVKTLSINIPEVRNSHHARGARDAIAAKLTEKGLPFRREELTVSYDMTLHHHHVRGDGNIQAQLWLAQGVPYLGICEDMFVGWIQSDDTWHDIENVRQVFRSMSALAGRKIVGDAGRLVTPLEWTSKREVIQRLKSAGLYDLTWWCEDPDDAVDRLCGLCTPCQTHMTALWQMKRFSGEGLLDKVTVK